jgi:hypothetical protein
MTAQQFKLRVDEDRPISKPAEPLPELFERWAGSEHPTLRDRKPYDTQPNRYKRLPRLLIREPQKSVNQMDDTKNN